MMDIDFAVKADAGRLVADGIGVHIVAVSGAVDRGVGHVAVNAVADSGIEGKPVDCLHYRYGIGLVGTVDFGDSSGVE